MDLKQSMLNKWDVHPEMMVCYSDPQCESYKKAAAFLGDTVEDWGGGTGWAKKYFKNYRNVDGSPHPNVDEVVDLRKYRSSVPNILLRQVLEANYEWDVILRNAVQSFTNKLCIVIYSPFVEETRVGPLNPVIDRNGNVIKDTYTPDMYFKKQDILDFFPARQYRVSEEEVQTNQGFGRDWILYVEKI